MTESIEHVADSLQRTIATHGTVVIAFSGGVDSAVVAAAAVRALGDRAVAITAVGPAVAASELQIAREVAKSIGIQHVEVSTDESTDVDYIRNDGQRCYYCKSNLYNALRAWADSHSFKTLMSGTNLDDLGDYRPGLQAAAENRVVAPLAELQITKSTVRQLAAFYGLSVADKPAAPCLASRIAYGQKVTLDRLKSIEHAEAYLNSMGFFDVRVRLHGDDLARLELQFADFAKACEPETRQLIQKQMSLLGFKFVTLDLMGRQSGSLNRVLPILQ